MTKRVELVVDECYVLDPRWNEIEPNVVGLLLDACIRFSSSCIEKTSIAIVLKENKCLRDKIETAERDSAERKNASVQSLDFFEA